MVDAPVSARLNKLMVSGKPIYFVDLSYGRCFELGAGFCSVGIEVLAEEFEFLVKNDVGKGLLFDRDGSSVTFDVDEVERAVKKLRYERQRGRVK